MAKSLLRLFWHSFLPFVEKYTLPLSELESFGNSDSFNQIWAD